MFIQSTMWEPKKPISWSHQVWASCPLPFKVFAFKVSHMSMLEWYVELDQLEDEATQYLSILVETTESCFYPSWNAAVGMHTSSWLIEAWNHPLTIFSNLTLLLSYYEVHMSPFSKLDVETWDSSFGIT